MSDAKKDEKINLDNIVKHTFLEKKVIGEAYEDYYKYRGQRDSCVDQFQGNSLEDFLSISRELFWNSTVTPSNDLSALDLSLTIGFARKETLDYVGRLVGKNLKGTFEGEGLDSFGIKTLQGIYDNWKYRVNDENETFWRLLYGAVSGTVCEFIGYNNSRVKRRYLKNYNAKTGSFSIDEKEDFYYNDVWSELAPVEDIYLSKVWERDIQRQGKLIWRNQMSFKDFKRDFSTFDNAEYVYPGNQIAEDSLYFRLLKGSGVTSYDTIEVLKIFDMIKDEYIIIANGIWLNPIGKGKKQATSPMPFNHKKMPFGWTIFKPIDEKFAYGMGIPFEIKDFHKTLNVSNTMLLEQEYRAINPATLSSDFESPEIIHGQSKVIPVNDINAYKIMDVKEGSTAFFQTMAGLQNLMTAQAQGAPQNGVPSRQPKSAREAMQIKQMVEESLGNTLVAYKNMIRQQMNLMVKTALQFYPVKNYKNVKSRILRDIKIPNTSLSGGGIGTLKIRLVDKKQDDIITFFESIEESLQNGKQVEIIEAPVDFVKDLDFSITGVSIEPKINTDLERQSYVDNIIKPMLEVYVPAGVADISKVYLRHLEKFGEHPADFSSEKTLPQLYSNWGDEMDFDVNDMKMKGRQTNKSPQIGNTQQSITGTQFGVQGGAPLE
jgi:hypothetical protein